MNVILFPAHRISETKPSKRRAKVIHPKQFVRVERVEITIEGEKEKRRQLLQQRISEFLEQPV